MVIGVGTDIVDIKRIRGVIEKFGEKFYSRILTEKEIEYCKSFSKPELHFAGRYAAKEAYSKAIGTGVGKEFSWKDIEIINDKKGKPFIHQIIDKGFFLYKFQVSISHTDDYACAVVICED
ncbi:MAG TPA: holo-ACP synthase [Ignavibacteria bacterium]|nr:holo-ACP synthase [Ignavibacteria bacterium]